MSASVRWILALTTGAVLIAAAAWAVLPGKLGSIDTTATLGTCMTGEPVLTLDGDWQTALPADARATAPTYLPLLIVYSGWSWDAETGELSSADGDVRAQTGDRVRVTGRVVEVHGDPSPCYYTLNLKLGDLHAE